MLSIKALLTKILHALRPISQTKPTAGTNVTLSDYNYVYRVGRVVHVTLNFNVSGSIASGATVMSGFPAPVGRWVFPISRSGSTQSASLRLNTNGTVVADGAISTTGYYDASFSYITAS